MEQQQRHQSQPHALSSQETYNPNHLLDTLRERMKLKNDAALSRALRDTVRQRFATEAVAAAYVRHLRDILRSGEPASAAPPSA